MKTFKLNTMAILIATTLLSGCQSNPWPCMGKCMGEYMPRIKSGDKRSHQSSIENSRTPAVGQPDPLRQLSFVDSHPVDPIKTNSSTQIATLENSMQMEELMKQGSNRLLIDFYAEWCGPCQKQSQVLENMAESGQADSVSIVKVDVEEFPTIAHQYQVQGLPTLVAIENGKIVGRRTGLSNQDEVSELLAQ